MKAIVNVPICAMYERPTRESTVVDEVLYGMVVEVLDEVIPGWLQIRTHYRYEGIVCDEDLLLDDEVDTRILVGERADAITQYIRSLDTSETEDDASLPNRN